jgi:hypothetical protein
MRPSPFFRLGLLLLALLPAACRLTDDAPPGTTTLSIDADPSLLQRDSVLVILNSSSGPDTLFKGKLPGLDTLKRLPANDYDGGRAIIIIRGFQDGQLVYEERRDYNGSSQKNLIVEVPLDLTATGHRSSLDITPDKVRLFLGGGTTRMRADPHEVWSDKILVWTTGDSSVATVSQTGEVTPVGLGVTYVRAVSGDTAADASSISVVRDPPVLDFGSSDTTLAVGTAVLFHVKVTQEYGDVAEFAWDLNGDGTYEGTIAGVPGQVDFSTPAWTYTQTGDFTVHVRVRDGEGNIVFASKKVKIGATAPSIDSLSAMPAVVNIKDAVSFRALASGGGGALKTFAWDFDGDGKADQSGSLQGDTASLTGVFNFPDSGTYKATLRITDADGGTVTASTQIKVKLDRPTADAGVDMSVAGGAQVRLRGRAADTLGHIVTQEWKIGSGAYAPATDSGTAAFTAPLDPGTVACVFRVTDDDGLIAVDTVLVTINDGKAPSITSFLPHDTLISIKDEVSFAAQAEAVGADLKSWALDADGDGTPEAQGDLSGQSQPIRVKRVFPNPGTFDVTLKVVDLNGKSATANARVTVLLDAPKADAGPDTIVSPGVRVNLHGRGKDSLGAIVRMEWKIGSGSYAAVSKGDTSIIAPATAGTVPCVFRVMDDDSLVNTDTMSVIVKAANNADLATLAISPATLAPAFSPDTLNYKASVDNSVTSVTITPGLANSGSTLKVNGTAAESGKAFGPINLGVGSTVITIAVTAQDGVTAKSYSVTVSRGSSTNADLANLTLSAGLLAPAFVPGTVAYTASVSNSTDSIKVTPTAAGAGSTLKVNGVVVASGAASGSIAISVGANPITIDVTAQDGTTKKTYTVSVTRSASANADLSNLALSIGTLSPVFAAGTTNYTASVPNANDSIKVTPTAGTTGSTLKVNTVAVASATASKSIGLNVGANAITIEVTAPDGITKNTYTVTVTRAASTNASLANLALSVGTLSPVFAAATLAYAASAPNANDSVKVTPTVAGAGATVKVNNVAVASGTASKSLGLNVGANAITVEVTAQDGTTKVTYTVTVTRAGSANADLSLLALSAGTLSPAFVPGTLAYTASVPNATGSLTATPTVAGTGATVKVNGVAVASGTASGTITLAVGTTAVTVDVTAQDGTTKKTYTVTVTRQPNSNADLSNLATTPGPASPVFAAGTTAYTLTVPYTANSISITATLAAATSTLKVKAAPATSGTAVSVNLNVGANAIPIDVTAQDGTTKKTYTLTVTRTAAGTNAKLSALAFPAGVDLSPAFDPTVTDYEGTATAAVASLYFQPTAADANATITVDGSAVASGSKSGNLSFLYGTSIHTIVVTAQDGVTKQTYNFTLWRPGSADYVTGYAWVNDYSASHQLTADVYNPGGTVNFTKAGTGKYTVTFRGLATLGNSEGIVQATAYGGFPTYCKVASSSISGGDFVANIACFTSAGAATDSRVSVIAQFPRSSATGPNAYALADSPTSDSYFPSPARSYNSSNGGAGSILITRLSPGIYDVVMRGMDIGINESGNPVVTAYGPGNIHCSVGGWSLGDGDADIHVACQDPATGDHADAPFNISYAQAVSGTAFGAGAAQVIGTIDDDDDPFGFNTGNGAIKVDNSSDGFYRITFTGMGSQGGSRPGNVQLTPGGFGGTNNSCTVVGWSVTTADMVVDAYCWDNTGATSNTIFNVQVLK